MAFTEEQIREAIDKVKTPTGLGWVMDPDKVIAELTRPQPEFREGEVVFHNDSKIGYTPFISGAYYNLRKLRLSELPEAVERLREQMDLLTETEFLGPEETYSDELMVRIEKARQALADFDREIEP